jgi:hypothetical protein
MNQGDKDSSVGIVIGVTEWNIYGVRFQAVQEVFPFSKISRLFLGPSTSPNQWVSGFISPWVERLRLEGHL